MKLNYPVIIKKKPHESYPYAILIPDLRLTLDLADSDLRFKLEKEGINYFIENCILDCLAEKDEADEDIPTPRPIDDYILQRNELYLAKDFSDIDPKKINHSAVILVGDDSLKVTAYFVENHRFVTQDKKPLAICPDLTIEEILNLGAYVRDKDGKIIRTQDNSKYLDDAIDRIMTLGNLPHYGRDDLPPCMLSVEFVSRRRSTFCARFLPTFTKFTVVFEFLASIPLFSSSIKMTENQIFPDMSNIAGNIASNTQAASFFFLIMYWTFAGPAAKTLGNFGSNFDDLFHFIYQKCCSKQIKPEPKEKTTFAQTCKLGCSKTEFTMLVLNFLFLNAAMDFQQITLLTDRVTGIDSIFPTWLLVASSWSQFVANQWNDPVLAAGFLAFGFGKINEYFRKKVAIATQLKQEESKGDYKLDLEKGENILKHPLLDQPKSSESKASFSHFFRNKKSDDKNNVPRKCLVM